MCLDWVVNLVIPKLAIIIWLPDLFKRFILLDNKSSEIFQKKKSENQFELFHGGEMMQNLETYDIIIT